MLARITSIGGDLYHVHVMDAGGGHPDQGLPGRPPHVSNRPPGTGFPPHVGGGPAWPERPVDPGWGVGGGGGHPDQGLPGGGGSIGQLPTEPPPMVAPGQTLIMVRDQFGTWYFATIPNSSAPPRPGPPLHPDQGLPGGGGGGMHPDQGLPGQRPPHVGGGPMPTPPQRPDQGLPRPPGQPPQPSQPIAPTPQPKPV